MEMQDLFIANPKRHGTANHGRSAWYRYYAGFSPTFALGLLKGAGLGERETILDPWNGTGTTTTAAACLGVSAWGFDLNPAMVLVARAMLVPPEARREMEALARLILDTARSARARRLDNDPLEVWLIPSSAQLVRSTERAAIDVLSAAEPDLGTNVRDLSRVSEKTAFVYVALFRTLRRVLRPFCASNPTWLKRPTCKEQRLRPQRQLFLSTLRSEFEEMLSTFDSFGGSKCECMRAAKIEVATSENLPMADASVDMVLTSPPYCTRIDYAVATMAELALLGVDMGTEFSSLRRSLIGSAAVENETPQPQENWGPTCNLLLERIRAHPSEASRTYYYKIHAQYFARLQRSVQELARVLKSGGRCVIVAQDSYYKDIHNDLSAIVVEMAERVRLRLTGIKAFVSRNNMAAINSSARRYRHPQAATESVLCLTK